MKRRPAVITEAALCILAATLACAGCATQKVPYDGFDAADPYSANTGLNGDPNAPPPVSRYAQPAAAGATAAGSKYGEQAAGKTSTDAETLKKLMAELQSLGAVDPETQARLLADFEQTDPSLWPMLMQTFRAGITYRQRRGAERPGQAIDSRASIAASEAPAARHPAGGANEAGPNEAGPARHAGPADSSPVTPVSFNAPLATTSPHSALAPTAVATDARLPMPMPPMPAPMSGADMAHDMQMSALQLSLPGGQGPMGGSSSLPTQQLLAAALAEAQRKAAESESAPPPAAAPIPPPAKSAVDDPFAASPGAPVATSTTGEAKAARTEEPQATRAATNGAASTATNGGTWQDRLNESIAKLEPLTREPPKDAADVSRHAWLRMLYLTAGRRDEALKPIAGISAAEQDYWSEQIYALATTLDVERMPDAAQRSAEARRHLAKAENRLAETGLLAVRNLAFCTEVSSYGVYQKFSESTFKANQPLILYAEVDNFKSEETSKGFHTALRSSYQIIDGQGRRVAENDLALTEEHCRNRRRDYFIRYFLSVPERIYEGKYTLQLTIVDTLSQKIGQASIDFTVGEAK